MIKKIYSPLLIKNICSYINIRRNMVLFKYNKKIQNYLNISINDYIKLSGIYFEGEKNGSGKEFNYENDELIFEGEYVKGKRNGKGKEYRFSKLKYEGNFVDGIRNGEGKEYDYNGLLIFKGEYLNGKKWKGKINEYYDPRSKLFVENENNENEYNEYALLIPLNNLVIIFESWT